MLNDFGFGIRKSALLFRQAAAPKLVSTQFSEKAQTSIKGLSAIFVFAPLHKGRDMIRAISDNFSQRPVLWIPFWSCSRESRQSRNASRAQGGVCKPKHTARVVHITPMDTLSTCYQFLFFRSDNLGDTMCEVLSASGFLDCVRTMLHDNHTGVGLNSVCASQLAFHMSTGVNRTKIWQGTDGLLSAPKSGIAIH